MLKETNTSLSLAEIAQRRRVFTELKPRDNGPVYNHFQIITETDPVYTAGGDQTKITGTFYFAEVAAGYSNEEERVKVRLDGWGKQQTEQLFEKVATFGTVDQQKIVFDRRLNLGDLAEVVEQIEIGDQPCESARQLRMYEQARCDVHFGERAQKPQYRLTEARELLAYDEIIGGYVRLKHTTNDPACLRSLDQIEGFCKGNPAGSVSAVMVGALSARTKSTLAEGGNHIVITRFEKKGDGQIDFDSILPPDNQTLGLELKNLGVLEEDCQKVLSGHVETAVFKTDKVEIKANQTKNEAVIWQNTQVARSGLAIANSVTGSNHQALPILGAGVVGGLVRSSNESLAGEEDELLQSIFGLLRPILMLAKDKQLQAGKRTMAQWTNLKRIIGNNLSLIGKTPDKVANFYSKRVKLVDGKADKTINKSNIVSIVKLRQNKRDATEATVSVTAPSTFPAAA